jgi:hypothetical protein
LLDLMMNLKMIGTCLGLEHPLRSLHEHLSLKNCLYSRGYLYSKLHVKTFCFIASPWRVVSKHGIFGQTYSWHSKMIDRNQKMFNFAWVLTTLQQCCLQMKLDQIITMVINWPNYLYLYYTHNTCMRNWFKVERSLVDDNYDLIEEP